MGSTKLIKPLAIVFFLLPVTLALLAQPADAKEPRYYIYGDAKPGTKFKRKIFTSAIPLNKPYAKLSKKDKAYVRSPYEGMPESETPPFPSKGYGALIKPIIKAHSQALRQGKLMVIATIDANGKAEKVEILSIPTTRMTDFINTLFFKTEFDPATCDGKPCSMEYLLDVKMDIQYGSF